MLFSCLFMVYNDDILSIFSTFHVCARIFFSILYGVRDMYTGLYLAAVLFKKQ